MNSKHISANTSDLTDPVCGMAVTTESEHHLLHNHHDYYFCSSGCKHKFKASPETFLNPVVSNKNSCHDDGCNLTSTSYTCPMHPEVEQQGAGSCPKCGMALEAKTVTLEEKNEALRSAEPGVSRIK